MTTAVPDATARTLDGGSGCRALALARRRRRLAARLVLTSALLAGPAAAQLPPSPAALAEQAQPVRVVCIADRPEAFLRDETFRTHVLARLPAALPLGEETDPVRRLRALVVPLGGRYLVPVGSAFVVDPAQRHLVSTWHVVTACIGEPGSGRRLGVLQPDGADVAMQLAEHLPDRRFQDASGRPVQLVQAVCRDPAIPCDADLPRGNGTPAPTGAERRRQLDNLLTYAPDLAVLRLPAAVQAAPLALALQQPLDDQMRLVVRSFGPVPVGVGEADAAARLHLLAPRSLAAVYTGPHQVSGRRPGGQPEDEVHARLHRLAASVQPGDAGAPVLRGLGVVGVVTMLLDPARAPGGAPSGAGPAPAYAVPVTVLAGFLNLLEVPYVTAAPDPLPRPLTVDALSNPPPAAAAWWADPQHLMLGSAVALALLAALAFGLLARRRPSSLSPLANAVAPFPPAGSAQARTTARTSARTTVRLDPAQLHAVAMPTAALDPPPAMPAADVPLVAAADVSSPAAAGVQLRASAGPLAPSVYSLPMPNGGTTLFAGRDPLSCQVVFPAATDEISAVHACFVWDAPRRTLGLRDLSSSGSWLNGQRVDPGRTVPLADGDRVDLGGPDINRFTVALPGAAVAPEDPR